MNKAELIKALESVTDDMPIWLGVDAGEGYPTLEEVFVANAIDVPYDGDEASGHEHDYIKKSDYVAQAGDELEDKGDEWSVTRPMIILGERRSKEEVESIRHNRLNREAITKARLIGERDELKKKLALIEKDLKK